MSMKGVWAHRSKGPAKPRRKALWKLVIEGLE